MNESQTVKVIGRKIMNLPDRPPFMLDKDLAEIYGTKTERINQQVKRNSGRFPEDFVFQLTKEEAESCILDFEVADCDLKKKDGKTNLKFKLANCKLENGENGKANLKSQTVTSSFDKRGGNIKYLPYGFTRNGANMLSTVLNTPVAIERSVQIMRAFSDMEEVCAIRKGYQPQEGKLPNPGQAMEAISRLCRDISPHIKDKLILRTLHYFTGLPVEDFIKEIEERISQSTIKTSSRAGIIVKYFDALLRSDTYQWGIEKGITQEGNQYLEGGTTQFFKAFACIGKKEKLSSFCDNANSLGAILGYEAAELEYMGWRRLRIRTKKQRVLRFEYLKGGKE